MTAVKLRAVPVASFTVIMATGIVAVTARDNGYPVVALALAVLAGGGFALLGVWAVLARVVMGHVIARDGTALDRTYGLFGVVAAADVVAAQFHHGAAVPVALLGVVALVAWAMVLGRLVVVLRGTGLAALCATARGSWLLASVATQSLVLTGARLPASPALLVASMALWTAGVLGYLVIAVGVVRRLVRARLAPGLLTPDVWILMGALAIAVVAGGSLVGDLDAVGRVDWLHGVGVATVAGCWLVATAWIPLLVAAEVRRVRAGWLGYEPARWATIFPLGMYGAACARLAMIAPSARAALDAASAVMFVVALAAWCATAVGMVVHIGWSSRTR